MMIIIGAESGRLSCPLSLFSTRQKEEKKAPPAECCWAFGLHNRNIFHATRRKKAALPERRRRPQQWGRRTLCCHRRGWAFGPRAREEGSFITNTVQTFVFITSYPLPHISVQSTHLNGYQGRPKESEYCILHPVAGPSHHQCWLAFFLAPEGSHFWQES